jgi:serine/threonine protein kinase/Tol biopolymer transport system component
MALTSGTRLGPYEIQCPLGAGGMGEVYRARDTRLDRVVAIKILASHLSSSPELKQRMEREARAISSLNHPHICHLYDIGSQGGTDYLVMEFLEGETLADRLRKSALPLNEIYKIGIAVAEALAVAHRQGIVHRDLKPGNIMLTPGGAKLMDFGLAKPLGLTTVASGTVPAFTALPTMSGPSPMTPLTTAGSIVGTIQYMSPEQIEGKEADARSDIFAFGAVLYEMTAGKRPFEGKSQISLASSILEKDPEPISELKPQTPTAFEHVVTTCLQKNPEERYQTAHDIKLELQWIAKERPAPAAAVAAEPAPPARSPLGWAAAVAVALLLGSVAGFLLHRPHSSAMSIRTVIDPPPGSAFRLTDDAGGPPVVSPDGSTLAFSAIDQQGKNGLWVRPMNSVEGHALAGTDDAIFPFWSPDNRSLGFFVDGKLKTIDVNGGSPVVVCDALLGRGGTWAASGVIVFSPGPIGPLMRVNASGGNPVEATKIDTQQHSSHRWPFFLPDGKHFLYLALNHDRAQSGNDAIYYASLDGRENKVLLRTQSSAVYAGGFLLFVRGDQLMAQAFDPANGTLSGDPQGVAKGVISDATTWHTDASAADNGLLVFGSGGSGDVQLVWLDRKGNQIGVAADKFTSLRYAQVSPQGDRVVLQIDSGTNDVWVLDPARGVRTRLTFGPVSNNFPIWSADGKWVTYFSLRDGKSTIYRKPSDGSGAEELLVTDDRGVIPSDWSRDGKTLIYQRGPLGGPFDMWLLPLEGERKPRMLLAHAGDGRLSPDGHWLAYDSVESGSPEVYVVPFGGGEGKWQVSPSGGNTPLWSGDGKELYYMDGTSSIQAVPVRQAGGALQFGAPQTLVSRLTILSVPFFSVMPDGKKILVARVAQQVSPSVTVVTNFIEGLKQ